MKKIGRYIVANGRELSVRPTHPKYFHWMVVTENFQFVDSYEKEEFAIIRAKGLDKLERLEMDEQIENMLKGESHE